MVGGRETRSRFSSVAGYPCSFRSCAAKMQTNTGDVPFSRVIGFTRNETIFIASYVPSPCILIVSRKWRSFRIPPLLYKFHTRVLWNAIALKSRKSSIEPHHRLLRERYSMIFSHFVVPCTPPRRWIRRWRLVRPGGKIARGCLH